MTKKPVKPPRGPDQPMLCPQCQAMVSKNTLNEHFVLVHGRKEATTGLGQPGGRTTTKTRKEKAQARRSGQNKATGKEKSAESISIGDMPEQNESDTLPAQGEAPVVEQTKKDLVEGLVRCPVCGKKVKRGMLGQHYQTAHVERAGFKPSRGKKAKSKANSASSDDPKPDIA